MSGRIIPAPFAAAPSATSPPPGSARRNAPPFGARSVVQIAVPKSAPPSRESAATAASMPAPGDPHVEPLADRPGAADGHLARVDPEAGGGAGGHRVGVVEAGRPGRGVRLAGVDQHRAQARAVEAAVADDRRRGQRARGVHHRRGERARRRRGCRCPSAPRASARRRRPTARKPRRRGHRATRGGRRVPPAPGASRHGRRGSEEALRLGEPRHDVEVLHGLARPRPCPGCRSRRTR